LTHAEMVEAREVEGLIELVRGVNAGAMVAIARHEWGGLRIDGRGREAGWHGSAIGRSSRCARSAIRRGFLRGVWVVGS